MTTPTSPATPSTSKRGLLRALLGFGVTATGMVVAADPAEAAIGSQPARRPGADGKRYGMLVDIRRCIGCQACTVSCSMENLPPLGQFRTTVLQYEVDTKVQGAPPAMVSLPRLCNHCDNPPCIPVCPVGATYKREDGIVAVDGDRCVGCAYCVQACPYDARFINHETNKADKCTFCAHRVDAGLLPACVETCVGGARIFGDINDAEGELARRLKEAQPQLKVLKPELETAPRVFYIGLDERFTGKVEGEGTLWKPRNLHSTAHG